MAGLDAPLTLYHALVLFYLVPAGVCFISALCSIAVFLWHDLRHRLGWCEPHLVETVDLPSSRLTAGFVLGALITPFLPGINLIQSVLCLVYLNNGLLQRLSRWQAPLLPDTCRWRAARGRKRPQAMEQARARLMSAGVPGDCIDEALEHCKADCGGLTATFPPPPDADCGPITSGKPKLH